MIRFTTREAGISRATESAKRAVRLTAPGPQLTASRAGRSEVLDRPALVGANIKQIAHGKGQQKQAARDLEIGDGNPESPENQFDEEDDPTRSPKRFQSRYKAVAGDVSARRERPIR